MYTHCDTPKNLNHRALISRLNFGTSFPTNLIKLWIQLPSNLRNNDFSIWIHWNPPNMFFPLVPPFSTHKTHQTPNHPGTLFDPLLKSSPEERASKHMPAIRSNPGSQWCWHWKCLPRKEGFVWLSFFSEGSELDFQTSSFFEILWLFREYSNHLSGKSYKLRGNRHVGF